MSTKSNGAHAGSTPSLIMGWALSHACSSSVSTIPVLSAAVAGAEPKKIRTKARTVIRDLLMNATLSRLFTFPRFRVLEQALAEILEYKLNLLELDIFPKTFWVHLIDEIPSIE